MLKLPNFLIIGAARCGTSSLHRNLEKHPQIAPPRIGGNGKEVHFFDHESKFKRGLSWYAKKWHDAKPDQLRFESTPNYLFHRQCPKRISHAIPNGRFIVMLRNPVDRAWSHFYFWHEKHGWSLDILKDKFSEILRKGIYYDQLRRWLCEYPLDRFLIIRSEDFFAAPGKVITDVHRWLGIKAIMDTKPTYFDPKREGAKKRTFIPKPPKDTEKFLRIFYAPHNQMLEDLLERGFEWS